MNKTKKLSLITGSIIALGGAGYWMHLSYATKWSRGAAAGTVGAEKSIQAQLYEIRKDRLSDALEGLIGTIKGNTIELTFNGQEERLSAVRAQVGQRVKKGDVLFELDHTRAEARKNQAEANAQRARELQAVGGATQHDVEEAQATLRLAQKDFDDTTVFAPQEGFVSQINHQIGETINRNEVVGVLISTHDKFYLETGVVEGQLEQVAQGQKVIAEIEAFGNRPIHGSVQGVSREVTTTGRIGTVLIALPDSIQSKLRPGLSARCKIYVFNEKTLPIPRSAYDQEKKGVYLVGEDQKAHLLKVTLGHLTRDFYAVTEGLKEGDKIINDLVATPAEDNVDVTATGEVVTYKNPEEGSGTAD